MWWRNYSQNLSQKIKIEHISKSIVYKVFYSLFLLYDKLYQNILKLCCRSLAFTSYKAFIKNKERYKTKFPLSSMIQLPRA